MSPIDQSQFSHRSCPLPGMQIQAEIRGNLSSGMFLGFGRYNGEDLGWRSGAPSGICEKKTLRGNSNP